MYCRNRYTSVNCAECEIEGRCELPSIYVEDNDQRFYYCGRCGDPVGFLEEERCDVCGRLLDIGNTSGGEMPYYIERNFERD